MLRSLIVTVFVAFLQIGVAYAGCSTVSPGCDGSATLSNTTNEVRCYVVLSDRDNDSRNFCLNPGESETLSVQYGDKYCVATGFTPNANACVPQYFLTQ